MPSSPVSVLILYTIPRTVPQGGFCESEAGVLDEVAAVEAALKKLHITSRSVGVKTLADLPVVLGGADETVVFNLIEGFWVRPEDLNFVPTLAQAFGKACTGTDATGLVLSLNKAQTKALLIAAGLPCPNGVLVEPGARYRVSFPGPYIVKPVCTDASEGIDNASICTVAGAKLKAAVRRIHDRLNQPALIEQFIDGRELNVSVVWRKGRAQVLPVAEIEFRGFDGARPRIVGYEAKWRFDSFEYSHTVRVVPAGLPKRVADKVGQLAVAACKAVGCQDYSRVDFRLDRRLNPYILEVNANPDISPEAGLAGALKAAGIRYEPFIKLLIGNALARMPKAAKPPARTRTRDGILKTGDRTIRWCEQRDRQAVVDILAHTRFFRPDEMEIAKEVLDAGIKDGPPGHYQSYVIADAGKVRGWVCFGPTPCTLGSFDIYWIAVDKACQGLGLGRKMMDFAERQIADRSGRLAVAETSSRQAYDPTRTFYERLGYTQAAWIRDFYGPGDAKVVYTKVVERKRPGLPE